jgi:hypothetical protein
LPKMANLARLNGLKGLAAAYSSIFALRIYEH